MKTIYKLIGLCLLIFIAIKVGHFIQDRRLMPPGDPEIFFIASESDPTHFRFIIANPPKDGNELIKLILTHEKTLKLPEKEYYLTYFKETRKTPRHFDSKKDCPVDFEEPSCLDKGTLIVSIFFYSPNDQSIQSKIPYTNKENFMCKNIGIYSNGEIWEYCSDSSGKSKRFYYRGEHRHENTFGL